MKLGGRHGPGIESEAHHQWFPSQILYYICQIFREKDENKQQRPGLAHIFPKLWNKV